MQLLQKAFAFYYEIRLPKTADSKYFYPKLVTRWNISNIQNLEMEDAMVMTITEMRELKEQKKAKGRNRRKVRY